MGLTRVAFSKYYRFLSKSRVIFRKRIQWINIIIYLIIIYFKYLQLKFWILSIQFRKILTYLSTFPIVLKSYLWILTVVKNNFLFIRHNFLFIWVIFALLPKFPLDTQNPTATINNKRVLSWTHVILSLINTDILNVVIGLFSLELYSHEKIHYILYSKVAGGKTIERCKILRVPFINL